ncbi:MAG: phage major capsid protein [Halobacteriota archaeon]|nr:phage major capsid protein [Halobacteriota archaeon]
MVEGSGGQGGYTVPVEFRAELLEHSLEQQIVKPRATVIPVNGNRVEIPCMVDSDHSSNLYGGITIYRPGEGATRTVTNPTYGKVALTLHELSGAVRISNELLEDSALAIAAVVKKQFVESIGFQEDDDYLNGSGANQALGCLNSANPCLVTVTAVTGQGASTIIADNIIDMWAQLHPRFHNSAVWLANPETFPQIAKMSLAVGTGGIPVWMPAGGLSNSPYQSLMGRPLIFTEKCQALGTAGDIALCAFSEYLVGVKSGSEMSIAESMHVYFITNEMAYRFITRTDGQPWWLSALTPLRGSNDLGCFIVLSGTRT